MKSVTEFREAEPAYVHELAVLPKRQGAGLVDELLARAVASARRHDRRFLRLDGMSGRPRLRSVYERFGFGFHSRISHWAIMGSTVSS